MKHMPTDAQGRVMVGLIADRFDLWGENTATDMKARRHMMRDGWMVGGLKNTLTNAGREALARWLLRRWKP